MRGESSENQESDSVDALQFAERTLSVEHDSEVLEEAVHAKQTRNREFVFERSLRSDLTSGNKERNIV